MFSPSYLKRVWREMGETVEGYLDALHVREVILWRRRGSGFEAWRGKRRTRGQQHSLRRGERERERERERETM